MTIEAKYLQSFMWFQGRMSEKLRLEKNQLKSGWWGDDIGYLLRALEDEVEELKAALINQTAGDAITECVDVANFAMMIADNLNFRITLTGQVPL